jgi:hypothetical protein
MIRFAMMMFVIGGSSPVWAGLHISLEPPAELPAEWTGTLVEIRKLRMLAIPRGDSSTAATALHNSYVDALLKLESKTDRNATDEADRGGILIRLGEIEKAIGVLKAARAQHPRHFAIAANLATAWHRNGDLERADDALADAVALAPPRWKPFEEAHHRLIRLRRAERPNADSGPDRLWPFDFERASDPIPHDALATVQTLLVWCPDDVRLLWQLGEWAYAAGNIRVAANILDGCVSDYGAKSTRLRDRRQRFRSEADARESRGEHTRTSKLKFTSKRPIARVFDLNALPTINTDGVTPLPWNALAETVIERPFKVKTLDFIVQLEGKPVTLVGHMRPLEAGTMGDVSAFLLTEYAVGCWFCESPEPTAMIAVELNKPFESTRGSIRVQGTLIVNRSDPETYLLRLKGASVAAAD